MSAPSAGWTILAVEANRASARPITLQEFSKIIAGYQNQKLALGVSGGADSLALLYLLARTQAQVTALSVDHGMRAAAKEEIAHVAAIAARLGVPHFTLSAAHPPIKTQMQARDLRLALLSQWCVDHQVKFCLLAHHRADQAETFLFRLARHSGTNGLAAMLPEYIYRDCHFIRPLLAVPKERLRATLLAADIHWCEDPSNRSPRWTRTHIRAALRHLADAEITEADLAAASLGARHLRQNLFARIAQFLSEAATIESAGYGWLDVEKFYALPPLFAHHVLAVLIKHIGGAIFQPATKKLHHAYTMLCAGQSGYTLGGCQIVRRINQAGDRLLFFREPAHMAPPVSLTRGKCGWDRRFAVHCLAPEKGITLGALGMPWRIDSPIPRSVRPTLPALWRKRELIAIPHLGIDPDFSIRLQPLQLLPFSVKREAWFI